MIHIEPPSLGIAIPTYNRPKSLLRLLDSIEHQLRLDLRRVSVCVVDDGSDVDLTGLFMPYQFEFTYVYRPRREDGLARVSSSRNMAVANTKGDVVIHLDDDLSFHERTLSEIQNYASLFEPFAGAHWIWTTRLSNTHDRAESRDDYNRGVDGYWRDGKVRWQRASWNQCSTAGLVMPRITWNLGGGLDTDFDGSIGADDHELIYRLQSRGVPVWIAPLFMHIDDSETGSWRDKIIERSGIRNEEIFAQKHPNLREVLNVDR